MKDCEPEKGAVREGGFALGVSRGREEVRCDRREGEQAKGECITNKQTNKQTINQSKKQTNKQPFKKLSCMYAA